LSTGKQLVDLIRDAMLGARQAGKPVSRFSVTVSSGKIIAPLRHIADTLGAS
jgi:hypothetical protein